MIIVLIIIIREFQELQELQVLEGHQDLRAAKEKRFMQTYLASEYPDDVQCLFGVTGYCCFSG